jgi:glutamyl-tRNAGlu reductase-like protein
MSPVARALHERFDNVCRAELHRLRRKTASLSPGDRDDVDALTIELTAAIAARVGAALERYSGDELESIVAALFAVGESKVAARRAAR